MTKLTDIELAERLDHIRNTADGWNSPITAPEDLSEASARLRRRASGIVVSEDVLFWAFRYCLGRSSYAVGDGVSALHDNWEHMRPETRARVHREIEEWLERTRDPQSAFEIDREAWSSVLRLPVSN